MTPPTSLEHAERLPIGVRRRLGREVTADLEGAYDELRARGLSPEQAWARARALILPDAAAWSRLVRVHRPLYTVIADRLSDRAVRRAERAAVVVVAGGTLLLMTWLLFAMGTGTRPSRFLLPVIGLGAVVATFLVTSGYRFLLRPGGDPVAARERLRVPLGLTGITMLVGGVGALVDTYRFTAEVEAAGGATLSAVMAWLGGTAMLLSVTLGLALAGALGWFLLLNATVGVASDVATEPWGGPDSGPTPSHFHQEIHP